MSYSVLNNASESDFINHPWLEADHWSSVTSNVSMYIYILKLSKDQVVMLKKFIIPKTWWQIKFNRPKESKEKSGKMRGSWLPAAQGPFQTSQGNPPSPGPLQSRHNDYSPIGALHALPSKRESNKYNITFFINKIYFFTPRMKQRDMKWESNFWVCRWNPTALPFKWTSSLALSNGTINYLVRSSNFWVCK